MMDDRELNTELAKLEDELRGLAGAVPSAALQLRVRRGVGQELVTQRRRDWIVYLGAVAAALVLWTNLSWTACRDASFGWRSREPRQISAAEITQLIPELSPREAARQAVLLNTR